MKLSALHYLYKRYLSGPGLFRRSVALGVLLAQSTPLTIASPQEALPKERLIGPGVYGSCFSVAFHPSDPKTFIAGTDVGGFSITHDQGKSWTIMQGDAALANAGPGSRGAWSALFDPKNPQTIWLGGQLGLFKSEDGGKTSRLRQPSMIGSIAIDPGDSDIVYAGNGTGARLGRVPWSPGFLYKTVDGGETWERIAPANKGEKPPAEGRNWTHILVDPASPFVKGEGHQRVYAIDYNELWVSEDGGRNWSSLARFAPGAEEGAKLMSDMVLVPGEEGRSILFASYKMKESRRTGEIIGGPYRSDDNGRTWERISGGSEGAETPGNLETVFRRVLDSQWLHSTIGWSPAAKETLYWATATNVFRSDNLGKNWTSLMKQTLDSDWIAGWGNDRLSPLWKIGDSVTKPGMEDTWRLWRHGGNFKKPFYGFVWAGNAMAVSPVSADHLLCAGSAIRLTTDGGETWDEPMFEYGEAHKPGHFGERPPMLYTHKVRSTGAQVIVPNRVALDPFDPRTIAIGYMDYGLFVSRDNGEWWEWCWEGMKGPFSRLVTRSVVFDPAVPGRLYMVGGKYGEAGRYPYRSDDGGKTFSPLTIPALLEIGAREKGFTHCMEIVIDPSSPPDARTLYVYTTRGIYKSLDGGTTWRDTSSNLDPALFQVPDINEGPIRLVMDPKKPERLYFVSSGRATPATMAGSAGIYVTDDGGAQWRRLGAREIGPVSSFSICNTEPQRLYVVAAAPGTTAAGVTTPARLWQSRDGGATWEATNAPPSPLTGAYVHPRDPDLVYLLTHTIKDPFTEPTALLRSRDGGRQWEKVEAAGLTMSLAPFSNNGIVFPPRDTRRLLILTNAGVWDIHDPKGK